MVSCRSMLGVIAALCICAFVPVEALAQQSTVVKVAATKAGKGHKVCRIRLKFSGELRTFVCKRDEPCCAWHEINYVKCGSPTFGCL
jgi:hypothetical protein